MLALPRRTWVTLQIRETAGNRAAASCHQPRSYRYRHKSQRR